MSEIEYFLTNIGKNASGLAKDEILGFVSWTASEGDAFTQKQKKKMDRYLEQLATGEITKDDFEGYILDIKDLTQMKLLEMSVVQKAAAQRLVSGIEDLLIGNLLKLI